MPDIMMEVSSFLDEHELKEAAKQAAKEWFAQSYRMDNLPYHIMYAAIKEEGFDFKEAILEKLHALKEDKSAYYLRESEAYKKQMDSVLKENRDVLCEALVKNIELLDSYDLQQRIGEVIEDLIKRGIK